MDAVHHLLSSFSRTLQSEQLQQINKKGQKIKSAYFACWADNQEKDSDFHHRPAFLKDVAVADPWTSRKRLVGLANSADWVPDAEHQDLLQGTYQVSHRHNALDCISGAWMT